MKIIFFGTPEFAAQILSDLIQHKIEVVAVVSKPDRPKGRSGTPLPPPVKSLAEKWKIPCLQPEKASTTEVIEQLRAFKADLFVVVAYGEIISSSLLSLPPLGAINVHASLLPKYRGAAPIQQAIIHGEKETGITIIRLVKKMDAGPILKKVSTPIGIEETFGEIEKRLCSLGSTALFEVIQELKRGPISEIAQEESKVTFAPKIELEECQIDWHQPAETLHNLIRGVNPYPGAWCFVSIHGSTKRLKIWKSFPEKSSGVPGSILDDKEGLLIACGEGSLRLLEIQLEGKERLPAALVFRGNPFSLRVFS
jgi:methionyl-tRNA formyltransferase